MAASIVHSYQPVTKGNFNPEQNCSLLTFEDDVVLARCPEAISYTDIFKNRLQNRDIMFANCLPIKLKTRNMSIKKSKWWPPKRKPSNVSSYKIKSPAQKSKSEFLPILPPVEKYLKQKCKLKREETDPQLDTPVPEEKTLKANQKDIAKETELVTSVPETSREVKSRGQEHLEDNQIKTWNKKDASLLSDLFHKTDFLSLTMRDKKEIQLVTEEPAERVNQTAMAIDVKSTAVLPSKTLKDVLNPRVGDKVLHPSNTFQTELLTGVPLVYSPSKKDIIVTGTKTQYKKYQQKEYPPLPDEWYPSVSKDTTQSDFQTKTSTAKSSVPKITTFDKGFIRWVALPEVFVDTGTTGIDNFQKMKGDEPSTQPKITAAEKSSMEQVLDMWQQKWQLTPGLTSASIEDIFLDMADLHPNIRCLAVIRAAKIGIQCKCSSSQTTDSLKMMARKNKEGVPNLLDTIISAVQCMLGDHHDNVKMAAALAMFCLEQVNDKAESVVRASLNSHNLLKKWVAAQCLGYAGFCDSDVISEIIQQTFTSTDMDQVAQGIQLLIKLSRQSSLVQFLVAEHLNSSRWQSRVMACRLFPQLHSQITKDISDKIRCLMWSDWHPEVRLQAAHCLGKTNLGKEVHDDLLLKLKHSDSQVRIKAIRLIGHLGMMTRKLALSFLLCFEDPHVSVRCETCIACGKLQIADQEVLDKLVDITTHDPLWKLKALAIQALGQIGVCSEEIKNCLLWSVHYNSHNAIRAEACRTLRLLKEQSSDVVLALQQQFLVENDPIVKNELQKSLMEISGWSPIDEIDEVQKVKHAVRMLSTPRIVKQHVIVMDHLLQSGLKTASLDCPSQVFSAANLSRLKADIQSETSFVTTRESQAEYPQVVVPDADKITPQIPTASEETGKPRESPDTETEKHEKNQNVGNQTDVYGQNHPYDVKSDFPESSTFLTEVHPQMFSHVKCKKENTPQINRYKSTFQNHQKTQNEIVDNMSYKDLIEPFSSFAGDSLPKQQTNHDSSDKLAGKGLIEKDNFVWCFNDLLLRYADLSTWEDKFTSIQDYSEGSV